MISTIGGRAPSAWRAIQPSLLDLAGRLRGEAQLSRRGGERLGRVMIVAGHGTWCEAWPRGPRTGVSTPAASLLASRPRTMWNGRSSGHGRGRNRRRRARRRDCGRRRATAPPAPAAGRGAARAEALQPRRPVRPAHRRPQRGSRRRRACADGAASPPRARRSSPGGRRAGGQGSSSAAAASR